MYITAQGPRLQNDLWCVEWDVKLYCTIPMDDHGCDKIKCGNCKKYVDLDHKCYMLKKDIKSHSEKYGFFDFESKLDPTKNKHNI